MIGAAADPSIVSMLESLTTLANDLQGRGALHGRGGLGPPATRPAPRTSQSEAPKAPANLRLSPTALERQRYTPTGRKRRLGVWLIVVAALVVLGGVGWGVYEYVTHQFYVGAADGRVAIYQGLPGSVAGIETSRVYEPTTIQLADLPISLRDKVTATLPGGDIDQARTSVRELSDKSQQCLEARAARGPGDPAPQDGC